MLHSTSESGVNYPFCADNGGNSYGNGALTFSEDDAEFAPKRVKPTRVSKAYKLLCAQSLRHTAHIISQKAIFGLNLRVMRGGLPDKEKIIKHV